MKLWRNQGLLVVGFLILVLFASPKARANVYATDIRINGSWRAGVVVPGRPVTISYILNDNASRVALSILSGTNVVKTITSDNGEAGTNVGFNSALWNGTNDNGMAASVGDYQVSITASSVGYDSWTNITEDGTNFQVYYPVSIAVNDNSNSPFYGRVFVGNAGSYPTNVLPGVYKYNADGSPADEGSFSAGGYPWTGGGLFDPSPWKMCVGPDDRLYVEDWSLQGAQNGVVMSFDEVMSTNYIDVLRIDNYPYPGINLSGLAVCRAGTNLQIYMADYNTAAQSGVGIISWDFPACGAIASNDIGEVDVTVTNGSDLDFSPFSVAVGTNGDIFTIQQAWHQTNDSTAKTLCFPPPPPGGPPDTMSIWENGTNDSTQVNNTGIAVDPSETYVAVASRGYGLQGDNLQGDLSIFTASNGDLVTIFFSDPEGDPSQEFIDVAWDNVGNLYAVFGAESFAIEGWRVYSPPGSNQATTVSVPFIQVYRSLTPPQLGHPNFAQGQLNFTLTGQTNVTYVIQQSADLMNWTPVATNFNKTTVSAISVTPTDAADFYRVVTAP